MPTAPDGHRHPPTTMPTTNYLLLSGQDYTALHCYDLPEAGYFLPSSRPTKTSAPSLTPVTRPPRSRLPAYHRNYPSVYP